MMEGFLTVLAVVELVGGDPLESLTGAACIFVFTCTLMDGLWLAGGDGLVVALFVGMLVRLVVA